MKRKDIISYNVYEESFSAQVAKIFANKLMPIKRYVIL